MTEMQAESPKINIPFLNGSGALSVTAWTLASPGIVLAYFALALELPMFLAGALISINRASSMVTDIFLSNITARISKKKNAIVYANLVTGLAFLSVIVAVAFGSTLVVMIVLVLAIVVIGVFGELVSLMLTDFMSSNVQSSVRMPMYYTQNALGGIAAIVLALTAHTLLKDNNAFDRHLAILAIAVACFVISGMSMYVVRDPGTMPAADDKKVLHTANPIREFITSVHQLMTQSWFRKFLVIRFLIAGTSLSVPFLALLAAETHHGSAHGLTWLIISSAAGLVVAAPLWRMLNKRSDRMVLVTGSLLAAAACISLVLVHFLHLDNRIHVHAAALFVATIALMGVQGARRLYFMNVAPPDQRVTGNAISRSLSVLVFVVLSVSLAGVAHSKEVVWAVLFIAFVSVATAVASFLLIEPQTKLTPEEAQE